MAVRFNHTIVHAHDAHASATFFSEVLGLPAPYQLGHFMAVPLDDGASFDFITSPDAFTTQHYAFLVSEEEFDQIYGRIQAWGLEHWPEPSRARQGEINHNDGGRGVYWCDPAGHFLEILTVPYGGWPTE
jgi:catechol 2,3-dioxygenase-like lactoylglutathione lyase family enzyme